MVVDVLRWWSEPDLTNDKGETDQKVLKELSCPLLLFYGESHGRLNCVSKVIVKIDSFQLNVCFSFGRQPYFTICVLWKKHHHQHDANYGSHTRGSSRRTSGTFHSLQTKPLRQNQNVFANAHTSIGSDENSGSDGSCYFSCSDSFCKGQHLTPLKTKRDSTPSSTFLIVEYARRQMSGFHGIHHLWREGFDPLDVIV